MLQTYTSKSQSIISTTPIQLFFNIHRKACLENKY